jgi:acetylornithine deacetylase
LEIQQWINQNANKIVDLAADLIRFNTVNQVVKGTELDCQNYVASVMRDVLTMEVDLFSPEAVTGFQEHSAYFPGKDYTDRPNVVGKWKGQGNGKSLLFSSHVDTAPVAKGWLNDPWEPIVKENRLFGLGSFDMKGGLAASIMAVRCLKELGVRLKGDVFIESVVDEEFGGANGTLACRIRGYAADAAIIPEPTNMAVCPASRGGALWRVTFRGNTGLSFSGESISNPVYGAAIFIRFLEAFEKERSSASGPAPWYHGEGSLPVIVTRVEAGDMKAELCDSGPAECHVDIWVECYPGVTEADLKEELYNGFELYCKNNNITPQTAPILNKLIRFLPGSEVPVGFPLTTMLAEQVTQTTGKEAAVHGAPFACDAFMFNLHSSTPAVIFGPVGGNAHAPDEFISIPDFYKLVEVYARTIISWCGIAD